MALYLVTLHYIGENGYSDSRRLMITAEIEAEAVARAREQLLRSATPPRAITSSTALRVEEPAR